MECGHVIKFLPLDREWKWVRLRRGSVLTEWGVFLPLFPPHRWNPDLVLGGHPVHADQGEAQAEVRKAGSLGLRHQHPLESCKNANWGGGALQTY